MENFAGTPTVRVGGRWSLGRVPMEPLFYNSHLSGRWGAATIDPETYIRTRTEKAQRTRGIRTQNLLLEPGTRHRCQRGVRRSKRFSELGLTHIAHLLEPMENSSRGPGSKASPAVKEPNPLAHARNMTPYAVVYPHAGTTYLI